MTTPKFQDAERDDPNGLDALADRYLPSAYRRHHPVIAASGGGAEIKDAAGRQLLDFAGGIGATNLGHSHPAITMAIHRQAERIVHTGPVTLNESSIRLAARLAERTPGAGQRQTMFASTGAESIENAVRLARFATGRSSIIAFGHGFHGRSLLSAGLTGRSVPYKSGPGSSVPGLHHAYFPNVYRPPRGVSPDSLVDHAAWVLDEITSTSVPADDVAAVLVEPIQGEGGYVVPPPGFLAMLRRWSRDVGAVLVFDEIQSGYGRTGRFLACEWDEVVPDIVVVGKSMANGLPISAIVADRQLFEEIPAGGLGGTFTGNPVACAAGLAVLDVLSDQVLAQARAMGEVLSARLNEIARTSRNVGDVRGRGPMMAMDIVTDEHSKDPAPEVAAAILREARSEGLLLISAGAKKNVVRVLPPINVDSDTLEAAMSRLSAALQRAST